MAEIKTFPNRAPRATSTMVSSGRVSQIPAPKAGDWVAARMSPGKPANSNISQWARERAMGPASNKGWTINSGKYAYGTAPKGSLAGKLGRAAGYLGRGALSFAARHGLGPASELVAMTTPAGAGSDKPSGPLMKGNAGSFRQSQVSGPSGPNSSPSKASSSGSNNPRGPLGPNSSPSRSTGSNNPSGPNGPNSGPSKASTSSSNKSNPTGGSLSAPARTEASHAGSSGGSSGGGNKSGVGGGGGGGGGSTGSRGSSTGSVGGSSGSRTTSSGPGGPNGPNSGPSRSTGALGTSRFAKGGLAKRSYFSKEAVKHARKIGGVSAKGKRGR